MAGTRAHAYREDTIRQYRQRYGIVLVWRNERWHRVDTTRPWMSDQPAPLSRGFRRPEDAAWEGANGQRQG